MSVDEEILRKAYNSEITTDVRLYVSELYLELFNKKIANTQCVNCIRDAAIEILVNIMDKRKYIVFAHIPILHKGRWYTQPTLTDELAEEYLKENPKDIIKFKKYPKQSQKKAV